MNSGGGGCYAWVPVGLGLASVTNAKQCPSTQHRHCQRHPLSPVLAIVIPSNTFYSRAAVAQVSSAFKELQPLVKGRKTPTDKSWSSWLGVGRGANHHTP